MATDAKLAQLAFHEALITLKLSIENADAILPADRINDAEYYVVDAFRVMLEMGKGWNPLEDARASAELAVVAYTKAKLMGQDPLITQAFRTGMKAWQHAAALISEHPDTNLGPSETPSLYQ